MEKYWFSLWCLLEKNGTIDSWFGGCDFSGCVWFQPSPVSFLCCGFLTYSAGFIYLLLL